MNTFTALLIGIGIGIVIGVVAAALGLQAWIDAGEEGPWV